MLSTYYFFAKENKCAKPYYLSSAHTDLQTASGILQEYRKKYPEFEIFKICIPDAPESSPQKIIRMI